MAAATARVKGRSKEGRETKRGREKGRQPMTERNMLSPMKRQQRQDLKQRQNQTDRRGERGIGRGDKRRPQINIYPSIHPSILCVCVFNPLTHQKNLPVIDLVGSAFYVPTEFGGVYLVWMWNIRY